MVYVLPFNYFCSGQTTFWQLIWKRAGDKDLRGIQTPSTQTL